ncbi:MAG: tRNA-dihydrouridine synthase [Chitinispirillaceae bacterium]|jgi:tRNA-dihydrouridine synthase|nr:tRNA-dihydrouridine synthase [Chitinispirillaceae bacterium]
MDLAETKIDPPFFLAPMAGVTNCAFRRLIAGFGNCGSLFTELLSAEALMRENLQTSTFTKKRASEGRVFYQLRLSGKEDLEALFSRIKTIEPFGIDINLGCPAPEIRHCGAGIELFDDREKLCRTLESARRFWKGILTVKCRLGKPSEKWQVVFVDRLQLFESAGIDAVTVHPRFSDEKLKRRARHELFPWITGLTKLPVIANGDIATRQQALDLLSAGAQGIMIGRLAAVKPWIFRELAGETIVPDYCDVWLKLFEYTLEDFTPGKAIGRIKEFTAYFARNFIYGHQLYKAVQGATDLETIRQRAVAFLSASPAVEKKPSVMGI